MESISELLLLFLYVNKLIKISVNNKRVNRLTPLIDHLYFVLRFASSENPIQTKF